MEAMEQKICIDTDVVISLFKGRPEAKNWLSGINVSECFVSSITVFELQLREKGIEVIDDFLNSITILPFDRIAAKKSAMIHKDLKRKGKLIDFRDIFIASTAMVNGMQIMTFNKKRFLNIPELQLFK